MMSAEAYEKLAQALDLLPGGFPRTDSGVELQILRRVFSPEKVIVACNLTGDSETLDSIAERVDLPREEIEQRLKEMVGRGIIWISKKDRVKLFRLAPFIVGLYEEQWDVMDHELAHLCERYFDEGGAAGIMRSDPALQRIVPAQRALKTEHILPYDDVKSLFLQAKWFQVRDCICRTQLDLVGERKCDFPLKVCLSFSMVGRPVLPTTISQEEALRILDEVEKIGLVHSVSNIARGHYYVCNCCGCCCFFLKGINERGIKNSVVKANYYAVVDPKRCTACGICEQRCQVHAVSMDGVVKIDLAKCLGCGLCVTGCPDEAVKLERRSDAEIIRPPETYKDWEMERLRNRGLLE